jgi:hypothetical protein
MAIISGTIIVNFKAALPAEVIDAFLDKEGLTGTQVSSLLNRYAIEVPPGKEGEYVAKLQGSDLVCKVNESFLKGKITPAKKRFPKKPDQEKSGRIEVSRAKR